MPNPEDSPAADFNAKKKKYLNLKNDTMELPINLFISALKQYEIRMNLSVTLILESDGSGSLCNYSTGESFYEFDTTKDLFSFLKTK